VPVEQSRVEAGDRVTVLLLDPDLDSDLDLDVDLDPDEGGDG
jgi:hypothetical protein